ncbi:MAG: hypothetical protein J6Q52_03920 [Clostridia bacterium]|nr:hypothetical protein [Clostridia bacterium]
MMLNNDNLIRMYLIKCGISPKKSGFRYSYDLIKLALEGESIYPLVTRGYYVLSVKYQKSLYTIDKCIQNAVAGAFDKHNDFLYEQFGGCLNEKTGKLSNKQFLSIILDKFVLFSEC